MVCDVKRKIGGGKREKSEDVRGNRGDVSTKQSTIPASQGHAAFFGLLRFLAVDGRSF